MRADAGSVNNVRDKLQTPPVLVGGFFRMCVLTGKAMFRRLFQWRECVLQSWFVMKVAFVPTITVSIPFQVVVLLGTLAIYGVNPNFALTV